MIPPCAVLLALVAFTQGIFFDSKVCYDKLGCFSRHHGFDNAIGELPSSPRDVNVTLTLFTPESPLKGQVLDYLNEQSIIKSLWNPNKKTRVIVHGFLSDAGQPWVTNSTKYFLSIDGSNVIAVNWKNGAHKFYPKSVANTRVVGAVIASVLETARDKLGVKMADVHLVGHSLGAHTSGYAGSRVEGVGRITGLDPAGPLFEHTDPSVRLDPTDAIFVDNMHTDGVAVYKAGFGTMEAWGHMDFYPNGARDQPGCPPPITDTLKDAVELKFDYMSNSVSCAHQRAHDFFIASLADINCDFKSYPCSSYEDFKKGRCSSCGDAPCPQMGFEADNNQRKGTFYLTTTGNFPYCHAG